ncbi:methyltransferase [Virgisporangium ochraceum]|uniref:Methyltransferase n=2 Tax=Virgisporangium ochraceum TaxID=65505 RepID=A0A8J3ZWV8_9ACTN|nr:methyltransferase [Virgisporangium ochraceum]
MQVMRLGLGYQTTALVFVMTKLGIADHIAEGPVSSAELARLTGAHPESLLRFLRAAAAFGLCQLVDSDSFGPSPLSMCLQTGARSLQGFALGMGQAGHLRPFEHLYTGVMENRSVAVDALGMPMWEYYDAHPETKSTLTAHLDEVTAMVAPLVAQNFDLSRFKRIVDVGSNQGHFLSAILEAAPHATGVLFDRPEVMDEARATMEERGLLDRVELIGGDFREEVPSGGDLYLLKGIMHDWDNEPAGRILANCHRAAQPGSSILSLEGIVRDEPPLDPMVHLIDLAMLLLVGGRERTRKEFDALFGGAGYRIESVVPLPMLAYFPYHIIEARRQ